MSVSLKRAAVVLLASGLSRRYGRHDKLLANLGGRPLVDYSAGMLARQQVLARVAVCPSDRPGLKERLQDRFVIAVNNKPQRGVGHSIAVGVQVALQFKPDAIVLSMADMPFIEGWVIKALLRNLGPADIVHAGPIDGVHPPTAFGAPCFEQLRTLDGDRGARSIIGEGGFEIAALNVPAPLLVDVDTREGLAFAERQLLVRRQHRKAAREAS